MVSKWEKWRGIMLFVLVKSLDCSKSTYYPIWIGKDKGYVVRLRGYVMRLSISYRGRNLGGWPDAGEEQNVFVSGRAKAGESENPACHPVKAPSSPLLPQRPSVLYWSNLKTYLYEWILNAAVQQNSPDAIVTTETEAHFVTIKICSHTE